MANHWIFFPVLLHMLLVISLYIYLGKMKKKAAENHQVNESRRGLYDDAWPDYVIQINNNIRNQFELPIIFYSLSFIIWAIGSVTFFSVSLSWAFVASRLIHSYIHVGSNYVPTRRMVFSIGCLILIAQIIYVGYSIV